MSQKQITLATAEFLDSEQATSISNVSRADLKRVTEGLLNACYGELGSAPHLLDGEAIKHLMHVALPGHLRPKDPLAAQLPDILTAFFDHVEDTHLLPHAFEVRQALATHEDALLDAVRSGAVERRATRPSPPVVHQADKVGRNDPCFCGSGKKFKKCCGRS